MSGSGIPKNADDEERLKREAQRWEYVKEIAHKNGMSLAKAASHWSIDRNVIKADELLEIGTSDKKSRRKDKYSAADKFCKDSVGTTITPTQLAEVSEFSYPTAVKYINDHPHHFRKVARGQYEIRDPKVDKKQEANQE